VSQKKKGDGPNLTRPELILEWNPTSWLPTTTSSGMVEPWRNMRLNRATSSLHWRKVVHYRLPRHSLEGPSNAALPTPETYLAFIGDVPQEKHDIGPKHAHGGAEGALHLPLAPGAIEPMAVGSAAGKREEEL